MSNRLKLVLGVLLALVVALGAGWLWGASGRWDASARADDLQMRLHLSEARAALAAARVDVFEINFGQASRHLETARKSLTAAAEHLDQGDQREASAAIREAITRASEAQQLAVSVNPDANSRAADAIRALDRAAGRTSR